MVSFEKGNVMKGTKKKKEFKEMNILNNGSKKIFNYMTSNATAVVE